MIRTCMCLHNTRRREARPACDGEAGLPVQSSVLPQRRVAHSLSPFGLVVASVCVAFALAMPWRWLGVGLVLAWCWLRFGFVLALVLLCF